MHTSALGRILVPGSMSPKPSNPNRGHSWAARPPWAARTGMSIISAGLEGPGSGRRGPASRIHGTCVSLADLAARSRASADAKRVRARTWSCRTARLVNWWFGKRCPGRPGRPPWIPPPAGPIASWGRQHTSWVLGRLSASHARLGPLSGLMHGHAQAEEACRR
jgi:hypothetical protein